MNGNSECLVVGVFASTADFSSAIEKLGATGFEPTDISILGNHEDIVDHFGTVPTAAEMTDRADTPRETLESHESVRGIIDFLSETMAVIAEVGSAAAAFAVGGPIGVATGAAAETEDNLGGLLDRLADEHWRRRLEQSVSDGGLICWVRARDEDAAGRAEGVLKEAGGDHIHRAAPLPNTVWPID